MRQHWSTTKHRRHSSQVCPTDLSNTPPACHHNTPLIRHGSIIYLCHRLNLGFSKRYIIQWAELASWTNTRMLRKCLVLSNAPWVLENDGPIWGRSISTSKQNDRQCLTNRHSISRPNITKNIYLAMSTLPKHLLLIDTRPFDCSSYTSFTTSSVNAHS